MGSILDVAGLHDFEQYHRDIFRKCVVQAHKHLQYTELFLSLWRTGAPGDSDYRSALAGFTRGIEHYGDVRIDVRHAVFQEGLERSGLAEKEDLPLDEWSLERVETVIKDWTEPPEYHRAFPRQGGLDGPRTPPAPVGRMERVRRRWSELGAVRIVPFAVGAALTKLGKRIQRWTTTA